MKTIESKATRTPLLSALTVCLGIASMVVKTALPGIPWASMIVFALFIIALAALLWNLRHSVSRRTALFGLNSATTTALVLALLGVVNFIAIKYPQKLDLTKNKTNTLSDQTSKIFRSLKEDVRFVYWAKAEEREKVRPLFDNLKGLSTKVSVEYVDTVKELARAKQEGIRQESTLQVFVGTRENKIDGATEEKVTNAVVKLLKNTAPLICSITDHGEKDFDANTPDGYELAKQTLMKQSYDFKKVNLVSEGKIPSNCAVLAIIGPNKAFFEPEVKLIREYLANGGAAIFALDLTLKGPGVDASPELTSLLREWAIESDNGLVVDPVSQALKLEATIPVIPTFSKEISITREMQGNTIFPLTRSFRVAKDVRPGLKVQWLTQTTPNAWGEMNLAGITKGVATFDKGTDLPGPLYTAMAAEGNAADSIDAAKKKTRIVVFGTSLIAANQWTRFGNNLDLFANSVSWLLEDESMISIRPRDEVGGTIQLSAIQAGIIQLVTIILLPGAMILFGLVVWFRRKKL